MGSNVKRDEGRVESCGARGDASDISTLTFSSPPNICPAFSAFLHLTPAVDHLQDRIEQAAREPHYALKNLSNMSHTPVNALRYRTTPQLSERFESPKRDEFSMDIDQPWGSTNGQGQEQSASGYGMDDGPSRKREHTL